MNETLTVDQIRSAYPDQWVLVGNPVLASPELASSVINKLQSGIVLYHSKDKREVAHKANELTQGVERFACVYTGEAPKQRRFWL